jgi:hypothetical protein
MSAAAFTPTAADETIFGLEIRNREAEKLIATYAKNHRWLDVGVGLAGLLVPGGSIVAMVASIAAQGPCFINRWQQNSRAYTRHQSIIILGPVEIRNSHPG